MTTPATPTTHATHAIEAAGAHDFDFFIGTWEVSNRRLAKPLQGSQQWETFAATQHARLLPGGIGNYDDFLPIGWRPGFVGMSLRVFNPETRLWSIFWLNNRDGGIGADTGALYPPVVGRFEGDVGLFYGDEVIDGQPIKVRFEWTRLGPNAARWQQAFSADAGKSWELNWVMQMTRQAVQ